MSLDRAECIYWYFDAATLSEQEQIEIPPEGLVRFVLVRHDGSDRRVVQQMGVHL